MIDWPSETVCFETSGLVLCGLSSSQKPDKGRTPPGGNDTQARPLPGLGSRVTPRKAGPGSGARGGPANHFGQCGEDAPRPRSVEITLFPYCLHIESRQKHRTMMAEVSQVGVRSRRVLRGVLVHDYD